MSRPKELQNRFDNLSDKEIAEIVIKELENAEIEYSFGDEGITWIEDQEPVWAVSWHNYYEGSHTELFSNKEAAIECYRYRYKKVDSIHIDYVFICSKFNPSAKFSHEEIDVELDK